MGWRTKRAGVRALSSNLYKEQAMFWNLALLHFHRIKVAPWQLCVLVSDRQPPSPPLITRISLVFHRRCCAHVEGWIIVRPPCSDICFTGIGSVQDRWRLQFYKPYWRWLNLHCRNFEWHPEPCFRYRIDLICWPGLHVHVSPWRLTTLSIPYLIQTHLPLMVHEHFESQTFF